MKIFAYWSDKPLPLKGQFQAALESFTNSVIHVVKGNLLSAKTAQDLGLIQLVNKVPGFNTQETKGTESTSTGNMEQRLPKSAPSVPKCTDQNIQQIIDNYFVGEGKLNTQQFKLHINEEIKSVVQPQRRIPYSKTPHKRTSGLRTTSLKFGQIGTQIKEPLQANKSNWFLKIRIKLLAVVVYIIKQLFYSLSSYMSDQLGSASSS